jgi:6-pyruvoyltetrahydropterin/6-carboxytetrahydropterin synthase
METSIIVTKCFDFCYGHYLPDYTGKCANIHGHNSRLEVSLKCPCEAFDSPQEKFQGGLGEEYPGMVLDFGEIKRRVNEVLGGMDHTLLNLLPEFEERPPTAENMARYLFQKLAHVFGDSLYSVRLSETLTSWAEVRRES